MRNKRCHAALHCKKCWPAVVTSWMRKKLYSEVIKLIILVLTTLICSICTYNMSHCWASKAIFFFYMWYISELLSESSFQSPRYAYLMQWYATIKPVKAASQKSPRYICPDVTIGTPTFEEIPHEWQITNCKIEGPVRIYAHCHDSKLLWSKNGNKGYCIFLLQQTRWPALAHSMKGWSKHITDRNHANLCSLQKRWHHKQAFQY